MFDAAKERFTTVFVEKDDEAEMVARFEVDYYPTLLWTDGAGEELMRTVQSGDTDEVLADQEVALELLADEGAGNEGSGE